MSLPETEIVNEFMVIAKTYYEQYDAEQLLELLETEWNKIEPPGMPIRTEENSGVRIAQRLINFIANEPQFASTTVATVAVKVLESLKYAGYDLSTFEIPIAVIIAYLVKSLLEEWKE